MAPAHRVFTKFAEEPRASCQNHESKALGSVVQIDEGKIQAHLDQVVRATVEETLNALLDAEADQLCGAKRYERTEARQDTRAGSYERQLHMLIYAHSSNRPFSEVLQYYAMQRFL